MVRPNRIFFDSAQIKSELFGLKNFWEKIAAIGVQLFQKNGRKFGKNLCIKNCVLKIFAVQNTNAGQNFAEKTQRWHLSFETFELVQINLANYCFFT